MELDGKRMSQSLGYGDGGRRRLEPDMDLEELPMKLVDELIAGWHTLSEDELNSLKNKFLQSIHSNAHDNIAFVLVGILYRLYGADIQSLKRDISKHTLLKDTAELSSQERRHLMSYVWETLPEYLEDCHSIIEGWAELL